jgi:hypothetical protein
MAHSTISKSMSIASKGLLVVGVCLSVYQFYQGRMTIKQLEKIY